VTGRRYIYKVFALAVVLFWAAMMWSLLRRDVFLPRLPRPVLGASGSRLAFDSLPMDTWMGIYFSDGRKVGYTHSRIEPAGLAPENGYTVTNQTRLELAFLDRSALVDMDARATIAGDGRFRRFGIEVKSGRTSFRAKAEVIGGKMHFDVTAGGSTRTFVMDTPPDGLVADSMSPLLAVSTLRPGVTYRADLLDPISFTSSRARVTLVDREFIDLSDERIQADRVVIEYQGTETTAWVAESGEVVRVDTAMGLSMVREPRELAEDTGRETRPGRSRGADMAQFGITPTGKRVSESKYVARMTIEVDGASLDGLAVEDRAQRVTDKDTGTVEVASRGPSRDSVLPFPVDGLRRALGKLTEPELLLESDDPEIVARTTSIVAGCTDSWQAAQAIYEWVYTSMEKDIVFSVPSALEVMHTLRGDCNEHTTLFVALARAAGIPAKTQLGVAYSDGAFYYHAWPAVYVGEWVRMDPTLGQPVADATHIKFVEGGISHWSEIVRLVGTMRIRVIDIEYSERIAARDTNG